MSEAIGVRLEEGFLRKIEQLSQEEVEDRSTMLRKLIALGYKNWIKERAAEKYKEGRVTLSRAAEIAEVSLWEMETFLVEKGFTSSYSLEDLQQELTTLKHLRHRH